MLEETRGAALTQQAALSVLQQNVPHGHNKKRSLMFTVRMNLTENSENKLWGIYHTDREYAQTLGDPLRTTIEAPTKAAAEEAAVRLGFNNPWAHPVAPEMVKLTDMILKRQPDHRPECNRRSSQGIRI